MAFPDSTNYGLWWIHNLKQSILNIRRIPLGNRQDVTPSYSCHVPRGLLCCVVAETNQRCWNFIERLRAFSPLEEILNSSHLRLLNEINSDWFRSHVPMFQELPTWWVERKSSLNALNHRNDEPNNLLNTVKHVPWKNRKESKREELLLSFSWCFREKPNQASSLANKTPTNRLKLMKRDRNLLNYFSSKWTASFYSIHHSVYTSTIKLNFKGAFNNR